MPFDSHVSLYFSYAVRAPLTLIRAKSVCPSALEMNKSNAHSCVFFLFLPFIRIGKKRNISVMNIE